MSDWAVPFFPSEVDAGAHLTAFEDALKAHTGAQDVLLTSSGTMALRVLARFAVPEGRKRRVILPAYGFVGTINAFVAEGYEVELCDVRPDGQLDWSLVPDDTDAIVCPVAFCGLLVGGTYDRAYDGQRVVIDAAPMIYNNLALATFFEPEMEGVIGAALSFSATKLVSTGQGGAVLAGRDLGVERTYLAQGGWRNPGGQHAEGVNGRMGWAQAREGLASLARIGERSAAEFSPRNHLWVNNCVTIESAPGCYNIKLMPSPADAIDMQRKLSSKGIESRYQFHRTINRNPAHAHIPGHFPVADMLTERALYLPYGSGLTVEQAERIVEVMRA